MKNAIAAIVLFGIIVPSAILVDAKAKDERPRTRTFKLPAEKVYAAIVQVASADYDLQSAVREGYAVTFLTVSSWSTLKGWKITAICRDDGGGQTVVTLSITQNEQGSYLGVEKQKDKVARKFWSQLDLALSVGDKR